MSLAALQRGRNTAAVDPCWLSQQKMDEQVQMKTAEIHSNTQQERPAGAVAALVDAEKSAGGEKSCLRF